MNSIFQPIKENMALFSVSAVVFFFAGYLLASISTKAPPPTPGIQGAKFGIHFFGRGEEPKVFTNDKRKINPHSTPRPRPRPATGAGTIVPPNFKKGQKFAEHDIHVEGTNGSIRWNMWIDNTYYCFLFDDSWNYIGLC